MTREELAKAIREDYERKGVWACKSNTINMQLDFEMLGIILEALEQESCEDAISRQAVLDEISDYNNDLDYTTNELYDRIKRMSSVNPQPNSLRPCDVCVYNPPSNRGKPVLPVPHTNHIRQKVRCRMNLINDDGSVFNVKPKFIEQMKMEKVNRQYNAGVVCEKDGNYIIGYEMQGAEETFSIGQPVYDKDKNIMGWLGIGLFENLNYSAKVRVPCEYWQICLPTKFCEAGKRVYTYWQMADFEPPESEG